MSSVNNLFPFEIDIFIQGLVNLNMLIFISGYFPVIECVLFLNLPVREIAEF